MLHHTALPLLRQFGRSLNSNWLARPFRHPPAVAQQPGPMAILRDPAQAYKPASDVVSNDPEPEQSHLRSRLHASEGPTRELHPDMRATAVPAHINANRLAVLRQPQLPPRHTRCIFHSHGMVLSGRMADVCAELERLALQEEMFLRVG